MGKLLSTAEVARYREDGYLCPIRVLTAEDAARYRARLEAAEAAAGGSLPGPYKHKPHLVYIFAQELVRQPRILDAVEAVIGPDILCWETVFFTKEPRTRDFISWHQDITYWGLEAQGDVVTAWVALSPWTPLSGCMRVVPGTHKCEVVAHADTFAEGNMLSRGQEIAVEVDEAHAVDLVLEPGEMSLHHVKIFHGSHENRSEARLNVYSPLGDSAIEACRVLRSENIVISCDVVATNFFWSPDNFILQDQGEVLKGRWVSDISANVVFARE